MSSNHLALKEHFRLSLFQTKSLWHRIWTASQRNTLCTLSLQLWTVLPKNPQAFTKLYPAFRMSQSPQVRQVSKQIRTAKQQSCFSSQSAPSSPKKYFTPPKNRVFLHGWFEEAQMCCVFRANASVHGPEAMVETLSSAIGKEWHFSLCLKMLCKFWDGVGGWGWTERSL